MQNDRVETIGKPWPHGLRPARQLLPAILFASATFGGWPLPAAAQGVRYTQSVRMEGSGPMAAASAMPARESTITVVDGRMRLDSDRVSTITDLNTGEVIMIRHDTRTYTRQDGDRSSLPVGVGAPGGMPGFPDFSRMDMESAKPIMIRGTETASMLGLPVRRTLMVTEMPGTLMRQVVGGDAGASLRTVLINEYWATSRVPEGRAMAEYGWRQAERMARARGVEPPEASWGEAADDQESFPLRTVMVMALVPEGVALDDLDTGSLLRGSLSESPLGIMIVMRSTTEVTSIDTTPVDPAAVSVPADYTEVEAGR